MCDGWPPLYVLSWRLAYEESTQAYGNLDYFRVVQFEWLYKTDNVDANMDFFRCWIKLSHAELLDWQQHCSYPLGQGYAAEDPDEKKDNWRGSFKREY